MMNNSGGWMGGGMGGWMGGGVWFWPDLRNFGSIDSLFGYQADKEVIRRYSAATKEKLI